MAEGPDQLAACRPAATRSAPAAGCSGRRSPTATSGSPGTRARSAPDARRRGCSRAQLPGFGSSISAPSPKQPALPGVSGSGLHLPHVACAGRDRQPIGGDPGRPCLLRSSPIVPHLLAGDTAATRTGFTPGGPTREGATRPGRETDRQRDRGDLPGVASRHGSVTVGKDARNGAASSVPELGDLHAEAGHRCPTRERVTRQPNACPVPVRDGIPGTCSRPRRLTAPSSRRSLDGEHVLDLGARQHQFAGPPVGRDQVASTLVQAGVVRSRPRRRAARPSERAARRPTANRWTAEPAGSGDAEASTTAAATSTATVPTATCGTRPRGARRRRSRG